MKILCIGHASYDITMPYNGYPLENTKNRINEKYECGGGPAANAAYLLGKWGLDTSFVGVLGDDSYAKKIIKEFKSVNVKTKYIELDKNGETTLSFVVVNKENGSRTTFTHRQKNMTLKKNYKLTADVILVDGQELDVSIKAIDNNKAISILDAGRLKEETIILGKKVNYLVCSKNFAEDFTNLKITDDIKSIEAIYNIMEQTFTNTIIITLEEKGCSYKKDGNIIILPALKVTAADTTGAGDIFHGAFTFGIANKYDLEKALKIANIAASLSVTRIGSRNSVFSLSEVMSKYEETL